MHKLYHICTTYTLCCAKQKTLDALVTESTEGLFHPHFILVNDDIRVIIKSRIIDDRKWFPAHSFLSTWHDGYTAHPIILHTIQKTLDELITESTEGLFLVISSSPCS